MKWTRASAVIAQELDELLAKSTPYSLSSPKFTSTTILDFVKGLILSTNIIELIDKHIPNGFRADWGQIIDIKDGNILSKECDIIIYEGKPYKKIENRCIAFVLVDKNKAKIVIQIKSSIQSVKKEYKEYCKELIKFVPEIWFISESCWANNKARVRIMKKDLLRMGYKNFFYFYRMNDNSLKREIDHEPFMKFIKLIKNIK